MVLEQLLLKRFLESAAYLINALRTKEQAPIQGMIMLDLVGYTFEHFLFFILLTLITTVME